LCRRQYLKLRVGGETLLDNAQRFSSRPLCQEKAHQVVGETVGRPDVIPFRGRFEDGVMFHHLPVLAQPRFDVLPTLERLAHPKGRVGPIQHPAALRIVLARVALGHPLLARLAFDPQLVSMLEQDPPTSANVSKYVNCITINAIVVDAAWTAIQ
jgi:hypothetical protein